MRIAAHEPANGLAGFEQADVPGLFGFHVHGICDRIDILPMVQRKRDFGVNVLEDGRWE